MPHRLLQHIGKASALIVATRWIGLPRFVESEKLLRRTSEQCQRNESDAVGDQGINHERKGNFLKCILNPEIELMPLLLFDSDMENRSRKGVREVAKLAQVSIGTVSNVINRPELVSPETVQRVEEAMHEIGYIPGERKKGRQLLAFGQSAQGRALIDQVSKAGLEVAEIDLSDDTQRERFIRFLSNNKSAAAAFLVVTQAGKAVNGLSEFISRGGMV